MESHHVAASPMPPRVTSRKAKAAKGKRSWTPERMRRPAAVPDDDGLENVLVHVVTMTGEWLWSRVVPVSMRVEHLQHLFRLSDESRYGTNDEEYWKLTLAGSTVGPYPCDSERGITAPPGRPVFVLRIDLEKASGVMRSSDTAEMWITAVKVTAV